MVEVDDAHLMYFDGSYKKVHDAAIGGVVLYDATGTLVTKKGMHLDAHSNNEAEYAIFKLGLRLCLKQGVKRLRIKGDSLIVVK